MKVIFATGNKGKIEQVKEIIKLNGLDMDIISEKDVGFDVDVEETGETFEENSKIKALALQKFCNENNVDYDLVIADDAGLCVESLGGKPGVYSARWAGENKTNEEKLDFLLDKMKDYKEPEQRKAMFVSVITGVLPNDKILVSRGECHGRVADKYNIVCKLTYNPIFIPDGFDKPIGEMEEEEFKQVHNHREKAVRGLIEMLK